MQNDHPFRPWELKPFELVTKVVMWRFALSAHFILPLAGGFLYWTAVATMFFKI